MGAAPFGHLRASWKRRPLSSQLVALITGLLALELIMAGTIMLGLLQRYLVSQVDEELRATATSFMKIHSTTLAMDESGPPTLYYIHKLLPGYTNSVYFYEPTVRNSGTPVIPKLLKIGELPETEDGITSPVSVSSTKSGSNWRVVAFPISVKEPIPSIGVMTVALPLTDIQRTLRTTSSYFLLAGSVIVVLGGILGSTLVRRSLLPLRSIESTAGKIAAGDLTQRIAPQPATTEVGSLALSLNAMLTQVEQSFQAREASEAKIRRFVSDASHELRTPLAAISGYCELFAMGGVPDERICEVMGRIQSESTRMAALVEDLLTLARLDEGRPLNFEDIDLVTLADNAIFDLEALDPSRTVGLCGTNGHTPPPSLVVTADRDRIAQVFTNLIGNIVRYTPEGSPVEIALERTTSTAIVEFRDHGPGIADAERLKVFERFYRSDTSRARSNGGSGLGLAIVSGIISAHKGSVAMVKTPGGGLTVHVELPLSTTDISGENFASSPSLTSNDASALSPNPALGEGGESGENTGDKSGENTGSGA